MTSSPSLPPLDSLAITARGAVTCIGSGRDSHVVAMREGRSGLTDCDLPEVSFPCAIGRVAGIEEMLFPVGHAAYDNRASRLAFAALETDGLTDAVKRAIARYESRRVGLVVGTSTSGVERLESVYRAWPGEGPLAADYSLRHHNDHHAVTAFAAELLGIEGPSYTISTACSSSAKALVDASELIRLGLCDAVLAGGVDSLCLTSLYGFEALQLVSRGPCRPFDAGRDGLSIGEAAGFVLIEREGEGMRFAGYGETSDATTMSTPPEDGAGVAAAMRAALRRGSLAPEQVDFVKLHGTATQVNDSTEGAAVAAVFGAPDAASLKGMIGHTLGAAGAVEIVLCLDAMEAGIRPGTVGLSQPDPEIPFAARSTPSEEPISIAICNNAGFGGSNCSVILRTA